MMEASETKALQVKRMRIIALVTIIALLAFIAGNSAYYTIEQGQRGIVLTNGKLTAIAEPGLHFKLPVFQTVIYMDIRSNNQEFDNVSTYSYDQQVANLKVSVRYRIEENLVGDVYSMYGQTGIAPRVLFPKVYEQVKNVFGGYTAQAAIQKRAELNLAVEKALRDSVADTGVIIEAVQIENIDFSDAYEHAVEAAAEAKANIEKAKSELARIEQEAQQKVKQAEAEAKANVLQAEADAKAKTLQAEAEAKAKYLQAEAESKAKYLQADADAYTIKARAEADAQAIKQKGDALQQRPELIKLTIAEKWDGELPNTMPPNSTVPFLDIK